MELTRRGQRALHVVVTLLYLFLHFGALLAEAVLHAYGLGGW